MEPMTFLDGLSGFMRNSTGDSSDRPIRIAKIDPAYDPFAGSYPNATDPARVIFEGETTVSGKAYPVASGYVPQPGARVYLVPIGNSWLIAGAVTQYTTQGFFADPNGTFFGTEFGGGSYIDSEFGLFLLGDAEILGDLDVGGIGAVRFVQRESDSAPRATATIADDDELSVALNPGKWEINFVGAVTQPPNGSDITNGDIRISWGFSGAWSGVRACQGPSPFIVDTATVKDAISPESAIMRTSWHQFATEVFYGINSATTFAAIRETSLVTVTNSGVFTIRWAQRAAKAGFGTIMRAPSFITARRVA